MPVPVPVPTARLAAEGKMEPCMPPDVAKAFDEHFGGEEDPEFPV
jgi:hypothetical protein